MQGLAGERENLNKIPPTSPENTAARIGRLRAHTLYNQPRPSLLRLRMRSEQPETTVASAGRTRDSPKDSLK